MPDVGANALVSRSTNHPTTLTAMAKKRGRPAKYASKEEKAEEDVRKKRARRQAQSTELRDFQFDKYYTRQPAAQPSPVLVHQYPQISHGLSMPPNVAASA